MGRYSLPTIISPIKSVQRGIISIGSGESTHTATVTEVNSAKASLNFLGFTIYGTSNSGNLTEAPYIELTNSTTITATRYTTPAYSTKVSWELIEYI